ncbi:MAG: hypothetical protein WBP18_09995 [Paracoccaceae bacterium]|jgi:hypothetical protein
MTRLAPVLLAPLLLVAACAAPIGTPVPQAARLTDRVLTLSLSDGTRCTVDWAAVPAGRMPACGPGYGYAVHVEDRPNILRQLAQGLMLALGAEGVLAPMAEVVITDPAGSDWVFTSPQKAGE